MKNIGIILIAIGVALMIFVGINLVKEMNKVKTPVPIEEGIKVIFVTPTK